MKSRTPRTPTYPRLIKAGSVVVKLYRVRKPQAKAGFVYTVAYRGPDGQRVTQQFASETAAQEEAQLKASQLAAGKVEATLLDRSDRDELLAIRELCEDVPPLAALREWKRARELTSGQVVAAAEAWALRQYAPFISINVSTAVDRFIAAKEKAGKQGERTYRAKLTPLVRAFGDRPLDTLTAPQLEQYLSQFADGVTRNDHRKRTVALCRWAQRAGHLPRNITPEIEQTERAAEAATEIGIISPATFQAVLEFFRKEDPSLLAAVVLAGFCGIRADELHGKREDRQKRQLWEDVLLDQELVRVTIAKKNTPSWRFVPLCAAAVEWLRLVAQPSGPVCEPIAMERVRRLAQKAGFALPENAFRHSFISHRIALTSDKPKVAIEAGNSVAEIDRRYRVPLPARVGEAWFAIRPDRLH